MLGNAYRYCQGKDKINQENRDYLIKKWQSKLELPYISIFESKTQCRYLGSPIVDSNGKYLLRDCETCSGNVRQKVYECTHPGHAQNPTTTYKECEKCPDYEQDQFNASDDRLDSADMGGATIIPQRPTLCHADNRTVDLGGHFQGQSAFFVGGGPSLNLIDTSQLKSFITYTVNNTISIFQSTIWSVVDPPHITRFPESAWESYVTLKIVPRAFANLEYTSGKLIRNCPAIYYFRRNCRFRAERFLSEPTFNWGNDKDMRDEIGFFGGRSVMLPAIKIMYYLGIRTIYLIGCDFHMAPSAPYAHSQLKDETGCKSNNAKFMVLDARFRLLLPHFAAAGLKIFNCTKPSGLTAFPYLPYDEAVAQCSQF